MKATRKLIGALAALVIAIAVATGSTFAWFTTNQKVTVESLDLQVTSGNDDLQIALGKPTSATDWSNLKFGRKILSADVLKDKTISLDALTSADTDHNGVELKDKENSAAGEGSYLEFDLSFYSNKGLSVLLGNTAEVAVKDTAVQAHQIFAWDDSITKATYGQAVAKGARIEARAAHASRIAFVTGSGDSATGKVWAPFETTANGGNDTTQAGFYKGNLAAAYYNYSLGVSESIAQTVAKNVILPLTNDSTYASTSEILILEKPAAETASIYYGTVTVKVWLEGTDGDCLNSIFEDKMTVMLNLTGIMKFGS